MAPKHPDYLNNAYLWTFMQDALSGESAVKRKGVRYLPMPSAMAALPAKPPTTSGPGQNYGADAIIEDSLTYQDMPYWHPNAAYRCYLQQSRFPLAVPQTVRSLVGIARKKAPTLILPETLEYLREPILRLWRDFITDGLSYGRRWVVVDIDEATKQFKFRQYSALEGIDWEEKEFLTLEVKKKRIDRKQGDHPYRYFRMLLENGLYVTETDEGEGEFKSVVKAVPSFMGKTLNYLPIVCGGSFNLSWQVDPAPMEAILSCCQQIYMKGANLSMAETMSCNPMLVIAGGDKEDAPSAIGSTVCLIINEGAVANYIEPAANSLGHMLNAIEQLRLEIADSGAALLGASRSQVESGDALRIRQNASGASLVSIMQLAANAVDAVLDIVCDWGGYNRDTVEFSFESDLAEFIIDPQELNALLQIWMSGGISYETLFTRLQRGGVIDPTKTVEDEKAAIEQEAPSISLPSGKQVEEDIGEEDAEDASS